MSKKTIRAFSREFKLNGRPRPRNASPIFDSAIY